MFDVILAALAAGQVPACAPLPGWEEVAERAAGKYLVLGESHGTAESPMATVEYVCAVARDGPVLLAIEFSSTSNEAFQRAWRLPHAGFREALIAEVPEWGERQDGVSSVAMLEMLVRLHALKEAGHVIDIVAFNGASGDAQRAAFAGLPGQEPHEAAQAANIRAAAQQRDYSHVVVLVGRFHSRKVAGQAGAEQVRPMAMLLAEPDRVISLGIHTSGGESWGCELRTDIEIDFTRPITDDMVRCGASRYGASQPPREAGFHFDETLASVGLDGEFALGAVTASPPAVID